MTVKAGFFRSLGQSFTGYFFLLKFVCGERREEEVSSQRIQWQIYGDFSPPNLSSALFVKRNFSWIFLRDMSVCRPPLPSLHCWNLLGQGRRDLGRNKNRYREVTIIGDLSGAAHNTSPFLFPIHFPLLLPFLVWEIDWCACLPVADYPKRKKKGCVSGADPPTSIRGGYQMRVAFYRTVQDKMFLNRCSRYYGIFMCKIYLTSGVFILPSFYAIVSPVTFKISFCANFPNFLSLFVWVRTGNTT